VSVISSDLQSNIAQPRNRSPDKPVKVLSDDDEDDADVDEGNAELLKPGVLFIITCLETPPPRPPGAAQQAQEGPR